MYFDQKDTIKTTTDIESVYYNNDNNDNCFSQQFMQNIADQQHNIFNTKNIVDIKLLLRKIYGYQTTQAIGTFVELEIVDFMFDFEDFIHLRIIQKQFKLNYRALSRLFSFLVSADILEYKKNQMYKLTNMGKLLSHKSPTSLAGVAKLHSNPKPKFYQSWQCLPWAMRNNLPTTMLRNNRSIFNDLITDPEAFDIFNNCMESLMLIDKQSLLNAHDFSKYKVIADIGAGSGTLLQEIMMSYKNVFGIFFDITVLNLEKRITDVNILSRCEFIEGNFLESVPFECDLYILRQILHNWNEDACLQILTNIHKNMHKNSVLMIIDSLIDEDDPTSKHILNHRNLQMFVLMDQGRERTYKDYMRICSHLFTFIEHYNLLSELSMIIAVPKAKY
ncbi:MAG: methyltransferase [Rickettsiales bacterium]